MITLSYTYNFEEKLSKSVSHHIASQRFYVGTTCDSADVHTVIELLPYPSQHILCDHGGGFLNSLLEFLYIMWQRRCIHMILYVAPQEKSDGVKFGGLGGHFIQHSSLSPARPIQRQGSSMFRYSRTSLWKWTKAPSCWKRKSLESSCIWGINHSCNVSR
jgi:hypothetical protein